MEAAARFVDGRPSDRIGLVFFADQALTSCPLTLDHETVRDFLKQIEEQQRRAWSRGNARSMPVGLLGSGTNTGLGMARALAFLEGNAPAGKAIVIITDGRDTRELPNWVDPFVAAEQAARLYVRVHAIGVGDSNGSMSDLRVLFTTGQRVLRPLQSQFLPDLGRLQGIADRSGGVALRANNRDELIEVFRQIDELEPSIAKVRAHEDFSDRFLWPLALGAALLALAFVAEPRLRGVPQ
jgi:Ca-activated chloride channel family protein